MTLSLNNPQATSTIPVQLIEASDSGSTISFGGGLSLTYSFGGLTAQLSSSGSPGGTVR